MNRSLRLSVTLLASATAMVTAIACGRTSDEEPASDAAASGVRSTTENNIKALPRDQIQDGGRLVWPITSMPVTYNYHHIDGTESDHTYSKHSLMPRIYLVDAGSTPIWNPDYLASEPILVTEPKQVVTYNINPKAIWYDGTPIT